MRQSEKWAEFQKRERRREMVCLAIVASSMAVAVALVTGNAISLALLRLGAAIGGLK